MHPRCLSPKARSRVIKIVPGHEALLRARRRHARREPRDKRLYTQHRWRVEGTHGEAKTQHGLRRAVRRGLAEVSIQAYLTAIVINIKRLAARAGGPPLAFLRKITSIFGLLSAARGLLRLRRDSSTVNSSPTPLRRSMSEKTEGFFNSPTGTYLSLSGNGV